MGGGVSDPRNNAIFKMFAMINIGERAGSGLANLKYVWKQHHRKEPNIYEKFSPDQTILEVPLMEKDGGNNEKVAVNIETGVVNVHLAQDIDELLLTYIKENKVVSSKDVAVFLQLVSNGLEKY